VEHWLQIVVLGLLLGGVYAMMASGLTLLFGVMRVVNLAHAAFILMISLIITMPLMFGLGMGLYLLLFPRLEESPRYVEMTVLLTFGLALIVEGLLTFTFTGTFRSVRPDYAATSITIGNIFMPTSQLYASLISFALLILLWVVLRFTKIGTAIRATMQNRAAAQIVGVNVRWISALAFGLGMSLAGAAGSLLSFMFPFFPARHWQWIALLLALIVLGGMGSIKGAVIGALLLAVASAIVTDQIGPTWSPITFYLTLFLILMVRPQGLFGAKVRL
jgi:branched-chain amino acid transport system permease protein